MKIFDSTLEAIQKKLDLTMRRHSLLSSNIANNETPNYRARDFNFSGEIEKALGKSSAEELRRTSSKHMDSTQLSGAKVFLDSSMPVGADGNNVDLDIQMGKISGNSRAYSGTVNLLQVKLRMLKAAARGRAGF